LLAFLRRKAHVARHEPALRSHRFFGCR
jgi:hypothetical protein